MLDKIKPPLVLMLISSIICGLLVFTFNATYVDTTGIITDTLKTGLVEIYGEKEYTMLKNEDGTVKTYENINSIIISNEKEVTFEIIVSGYSKNGIHVLVGVTEEGLKGISFISLAETPGLGTKIRDDKSFLQQFFGAKDDSYEFKSLTGATYSSKGLKNAVDIALNTYLEHKEEIINE